MKKITTLSLVAALAAVAACGNDVDVTTDTATVPVVDTTAGLATPSTTLTPVPDTSLKPDSLMDTTKKSTTKTP
jgi:hypothetical protein